MARKSQEIRPPKNLLVRVLFLKEGDAWVAQCLEYDIAAQAKTLPEAEQAFERTLVGQIMLDLRRGKEPFSGTKPAPRMYWRKFNEGLGLRMEPTIELPKQTPPAFMIEEIRKEARVA